jgi:hypothetical protein
MSEQGAFSSLTPKPSTIPEGNTALPGPIGIPGLGSAAFPVSDGISRVGSAALPVPDGSPRGGGAETPVSDGTPRGGSAAPLSGQRTILGKAVAGTEDGADFFDDPAPAQSLQSQVIVYCKCPDTCRYTW